MFMVREAWLLGDEGIVVERSADLKTTDEIQDLKEELTDLLRQKADAERMLKEVQAGTLVAGTLDEVPKETRKGWVW
jgi:hypothetical protein